MTNRIYVYFVDMPTTVHETVCPCLDGYTIYLNARISCVEQERAYRHAMWHINNNDFEKYDVGEIERTAHEVIT